MGDPNHGLVVPMNLSEFVAILQRTIEPVTDGVKEANDRLTRIESNVLGEGGRLPRLERANEKLEERINILESDAHVPAQCSAIPLLSVRIEDMELAIEKQGKIIDWLKRLAFGLIAMLSLLGYEISIVINLLRISREH